MAKAGDKVYQVLGGYIEEYEIITMGHDSDGAFFIVDDEDGSRVYFNNEAIGVNVFFDKAEAEKMANAFRNSLLPAELTINGVVYVRKGE